MDKVVKNDKSVVSLSSPFFELIFFTQTLLTQSCGGPRFGTAFRARFRHHAFHFFSHATRRIFPINGFLYSTCTQTWRQTFGIWRFITTITELTICFSNYRKLHNNIIRCFNYLYILLKYHGGMLFPSFINIEWQISHGDIIFRFKKYNSLFGHYFLIWFYLCMK